MADIVKTMKLLLETTEEDNQALENVTQCYMLACDDISKYVFEHDFELNFLILQKQLYTSIRQKFGLKSQMTISAIKTVTARYQAVKEQLYQHPYKYQDENGKWVYIQRTLEWLYQPIRFRRPQADLVRTRDYSFVGHGKKLSINTLDKRIVVDFETPECFESYFDGSWKFGTAKLVNLLGNWYLHISMTKAVSESVARTNPQHIVGIDRGIRFLTTTYDEQGKTNFYSGEQVMKKHQMFADVRAELQSKGTKSAKRALKRISGRENRWMSDVNHQISKALVQSYGSDTLFVLEDLTGVSFAETNLKKDNKDSNRELRTWSFYQLEQYLMYKAKEVGSEILKVSPKYTSQRCPKCGRIHKENRHHEIHEYICDSCGYRSNDDRVGAMNLYILGTLYVSGDNNPRFGIRKVN